MDTTRKETPAEGVISTGAELIFDNLDSNPTLAEWQRLSTDTRVLGYIMREGREQIIRIIAPVPHPMRTGDPAVSIALMIYRCPHCGEIHRGGWWRSGYRFTHCRDSSEPRECFFLCGPLPEHPLPLLKTDDPEERRYLENMIECAYPGGLVKRGFDWLMEAAAKEGFYTCEIDQMAESIGGPVVHWYYRYRDRS